LTSDENAQISVTTLLPCVLLFKRGGQTAILLLKGKSASLGQMAYAALCDWTGVKIRRINQGKALIQESDYITYVYGSERHR